MSELSNYVSQFKIQGPDGTLQYIGAAVVLNPFEFISREIAATTVAIAGEAMRLDPAANANLTIPRFERFAVGTAVDADIPQDRAIGMLRISALANINIIGVTVNDTPGAAARGVCAGAGSLICAQSLASATIGAANVAGSPVTGSATPGRVTAVAVAAATVAPNYATSTRLGTLCRPAGVTAGTTGDDAQIGIVIYPG